ncbi:hypothetical protein [Niabella aquatica]
MGRAGEQNITGVIVPDISDPLYSGIGREIEKKLLLLGFSMIFMNKGKNNYESQFMYRKKAFVQHTDFLTGWGQTVN